MRTKTPSSQDNTLQQLLDDWYRDINQLLNSNVVDKALQALKRLNSEVRDQQNCHLLSDVIPPWQRYSLLRLLRKIITKNPGLREMVLTDFFAQMNATIEQYGGDISKQVNASLEQYRRFLQRHPHCLLKNSLSLWEMKRFVLLRDLDFCTFYPDSKCVEYTRSLFAQGFTLFTDISEFDYLEKLIHAAIEDGLVTGELFWQQQLKWHCLEVVYSRFSHHFITEQQMRELVKSLLLIVRFNDIEEMKLRLDGTQSAKSFLQAILVATPTHDLTFTPEQHFAVAQLLLFKYQDVQGALAHFAFVKQLEQNDAIQTMRQKLDAALDQIGAEDSCHSDEVELQIM